MAVLIQLRCTVVVPCATPSGGVKMEDKRQTVNHGVGVADDPVLVVDFTFMLLA